MILKAFISLCSTVNSDKLYPVKIPQGTGLPAACCFIVSTMPNTPKRETSKLNEIIVQLSCFAETYDAAVTLAESYKTILDGYLGTVGSQNITIDFNGELDLFEDEANVYHKVHEYKVTKK